MKIDISGNPHYIYKMKRIAVDMDEVLADPLKKFIQMYHRDFGVPIDLVLEPGQEIHHSVPKEINNKWFEYINEPGFFRDLEVIPGAVQAIEKLQTKYDVYVVSAATEFRNSLTDKLDWLAEYFPFVSWENIILCGRKIVDVDIMIDDRIKNFANFKGRPLLFTSPHNMLITDYERVDNWNDVLSKLM